MGFKNRRVGRSVVLAAARFARDFFDNHHRIINLILGIFALLVWIFALFIILQKDTFVK